jgi:hypothetical protein
VCAVAGGYRVALGQEFDEHVAKVLGLPRATAATLIDAAKKRTDTLEWELRRDAFVTATTAPGRWLVPAAQRRLAIRAVTNRLIHTPGDVLAYIGLQSPAPGRPCAGLIPQ